MSKKIKFNRNPDLVDSILKRSEKYTSLLGQGYTAEQIATKIYMDTFDRPENIAQIITESIQDIIKQYHNDLGMLGISSLKSAKDVDLAETFKAQEALVEKQLNDIVRGNRSAEARFKDYFQLLVALEAYRIFTDGKENASERANAHVEKCMSYTFTKKECIEREEELKQDVKKAFFETTFLAGELADLMGTIQFAETSEELTYAVAKYGEESKDLKLILCMQAYTDVLSGDYSDLNVTADMKAIVYSLCTGIDMANAMIEVKKGKVDLSAFKKILTVLIWLLGLVVVFVAIGAFVALTGLTGAAFLAGFAAIIMLLVAGFKKQGIADTHQSVVRLATHITAFLESTVTTLRDSFTDLFNNRKALTKTATDKYFTSKAYSAASTIVEELDPDRAFASSNYFDAEDEEDEDEEEEEEEEEEEDYL